MQERKTLKQDQVIVAFISNDSRRGTAEPGAVRQADWYRLAEAPATRRLVASL